MPLPNHTPMSASLPESRPHAILGAGRLIAFLWRQGDVRSGWHYTFNLLRADRITGAVDQSFTPADVESLAKLAQVLAFELSDEACVGSVQRTQLGHLAERLDAALNGQEMTLPNPPPIPVGVVAALQRLMAHRRNIATADVPVPIDGASIADDHDHIEQWLKRVAAEPQAPTDPDRSADSLADRPSSPALETNDVPPSAP